MYLVFDSQSPCFSLRDFNSKRFFGGDFYLGIIRNQFLLKTFPVKINISITVVQLPPQILIFMDRASTGVNNL